MTTLEALESTALILLRYRARTVATPAITSEMIEVAVKQVGALIPHTYGEELQAQVNLAKRLIPAAAPPGSYAARRR